MTASPQLHRPQRLRAARITTRNALSSVLRLGRPSAFDGLAQQWAAGAQAMLRASVGVQADPVPVRLYPSDTR